MIDISRIAASKGSAVPDHIGRVNALIEDVYEDEVVSDVRVEPDVEDGGFLFVVLYARNVIVPENQP